MKNFVKKLLGLRAVFMNGDAPSATPESGTTPLDANMPAVDAAGKKVGEGADTGGGPEKRPPPNTPVKDPSEPAKPENPVPPAPGPTPGPTPAPAPKPPVDQPGAQPAETSEKGDVDVGDIDVKAEEVPPIIKGTIKDESTRKVDPNSLDKIANAIVNQLNTPDHSVDRARLHNKEPWDIDVPVRGLGNCHLRADKNSETGAIDFVLESVS